jgi:hypothetical protein
VVGPGDVDRLREEISALRREQERAEERAAAVADVIQTIARTAFDLDAVLQTVIDRSVELCRADNGNIARREGDSYRVVAFTSFNPEFERLVRERSYVPERASVIGRTLLERRAVQIVDVLEIATTTLQRSSRPAAIARSSASRCSATASRSARSCSADEPCTHSTTPRSGSSRRLRTTR